MPGIHKYFLQFFNAIANINMYDLCPGYHTFPGFQIFELERVFKHICFQFVLIFWQRTFHIVLKIKTGISFIDVTDGRPENIFHQQVGKGHHQPHRKSE